MEFQKVACKSSNVGPWNYIWKPSAKLPQTESEKESVAKKYGLIPEDYKPLKDSGDYPDLDGVSAWDRDNNELWDYPELKMNYNEPGPYYNFDRDYESRFSKGHVLYGSRTSIDKQFLVVFLFVGFVVLNELFLPHNQMPVMPKQKPYDENGRRVTNYALE